MKQLDCLFMLYPMLSFSCEQEDLHPIQFSGTFSCLLTINVQSKTKLVDLTNSSFLYYYFSFFFCNTYCSFSLMYIINTSNFLGTKKVLYYSHVRLEVASVSDQPERLNVVRLPVARSATDRSDQTLATRD